METDVLLWIALTNGLTNAITGVIIGLMMYWYGKRQGEHSKRLLQAEIKAYIKEDLFKDLKEAITTQVSETTKGIFGPFARSVNGEIPEVAKEWAERNPGVFGMLAKIGQSAVMNKMAKALGAPKEVRDYVKMLSMGQLAGPSQPTQQQNQIMMPPDNGIPDGLPYLQQALKGKY